MTPEGRVKTEIKEYLHSLGAYFFLPVQTGFGARTLDILCCLDGRFIAIEVKRPGKGPTKFQELVIKQIKAAGGIAFVADDVEVVRCALPAKRAPFTTPYGTQVHTGLLPSD